MLFFLLTGHILILIRIIFIFPKPSRYRSKAQVFSRSIRIIFILEIVFITPTINHLLNSIIGVPSGKVTVFFSNLDSDSGSAN